MKEIHELAEKLERRKLVGLKLSLFGFALGGIGRILDAEFLWESVNDYLLVLQVIGGFILLIGLIIITIVMVRVRKDKLLKQLFNDELSVETQLKTWKMGLIAVIVAQLALIVMSSVHEFGMLLAAEITIYVAFCISVGTAIVQEELMAIHFFYPAYDEEKFEAWSWQKLTFFVWFFNPGVVINELLLGQRMPRLTLIDKKSPKPLMERTYVPCPHCEVNHQQSIWSHKNGNAFKNWYGLYCPNCGEVIPCMMSFFSQITLAITYPLWFWRKDEAKANWLEKQRQKALEIDTSPMLHKDVPWIKMAVGFGGFMFLFMTLVFQTILYFIDNEGKDYIDHILDGRFLLISAVIWSIAGLAFGWFMKYQLGKVNKEAEVEADTQNEEE